MSVHVSIGQDQVHQQRGFDISRIQRLAKWLYSVASLNAHLVMELPLGPSMDTTIVGYIQLTAANGQCHMGLTN